MLDYLPKNIDLQFAHAEWQIHSRLPKVVIPLQTEELEWKLSESGSQVSCRGFTLVPDYASIGVMMQGENDLRRLQNVAAVPGMAEILTTYVILSRVKQADGLLLLRAFSPSLFRFGSSPGPVCLVKHLQRRPGTSRGLIQTP